MNIRRKGIDYLEGDKIAPTNATKAVVEAYARRVSTMCNYASGGDLGDVIKFWGGRIHYQHLDEWLDENGSIFVHGEFDFDIPSAVVHESQTRPIYRLP